FVVGLVAAEGLADPYLVLPDERLRLEAGALGGRVVPGVGEPAAQRLVVRELQRPEVVRTADDDHRGGAIVRPISDVIVEEAKELEELPPASTPLSLDRRLRLVEHDDERREAKQVHYVG